MTHQQRRFFFLFIHVLHITFIITKIWFHFYAWKKKKSSSSLLYTKKAKKRILPFLNLTSFDLFSAYSKHTIHYPFILYFRWDISVESLECKVPHQHILYLDVLEGFILISKNTCSTVYSFWIRYGNTVAAVEEFIYILLSYTPPIQIPNLNYKFYAYE